MSNHKNKFPEAIDWVLSEMYKTNLYVIAPKVADKYKAVIEVSRDEHVDFARRVEEIMLSEGLIYVAGPAIIHKSLTNLGKEMFEGGGWRKHLKKQRVEKKLKVVTSLILPILALLVSAVVAYTNLKRNNRLESSIDELSNRVNKLDSMLKVQILPVKNEIDSLSKLK
jgi:hypothetical protein